ncbi:MAG TPA: hypothetical protein VG245_11225 [Candidatus Dormibacteraeota bacterium]|nr:hypothetical protein [Candidatus Dormibacteraeota bacterium]
MIATIDLGPRIATQAEALAAANRGLASPKAKARAYLEQVQAIHAVLSSPPLGPELERIDPYLFAGLHLGLSNAAFALTAPRDEGRAALRISLEQARQALRDYLELLEVSDLRPVADLVRWLVAELDVPQAEVAELVGTNLRTLQRWLHANAKLTLKPAQEARVRAVAKATRHLLHSLSGPGVAHWFHRPHPDLHGRAPMAMLAEPDAVPQLLLLASRTRSHNAS